VYTYLISVFEEILTEEDKKIMFAPRIQVFKSSLINCHRSKSLTIHLITKLGLNLNAKILFILTRPNKNFWLASRNLKNIEVTSVNCLNLKQLLQTSNIIISNNSLKLINTKYGK
jgi:ribosomal protein L4